METVGFFLLFGTLATWGTFIAIWPAKFVAFREHRRWSNSIWSGGWFYSTPDRTRAMGALLAVIGIAALMSRIGAQ
jgi:hypothetical protein